MFLVNMIFSSIIIVFSYLYIASKLFNQKIYFKNKKNIISIITLIILLPIISFFFNNFIKTILTFSAVTITCHIIFQDNFYKSLLVTAVIFSYYFIAELLFSITLMVGFRVDATALIKYWKGYFWTDGLISIIAIAISCIKSINHFSEKLINTNNQTQYLEVVVTAIFCISILVTNNGNYLGFNANYLVNLILIVIFGIIIYNLVSEKEYSRQLSDRYEQLFRYMEKYEKEISQKSICIHEFKNQIVSIKGFTTKKDKDLNLYLDSIISDLKKTESTVFKSMKNLPKGGIKGLIYYKLGYLEDEKINVMVDISSSVKKCSFSKTSPNFYKDILKVIGVYLDNAIEAARISDKKEIALEIYYEDQKFNLILSNSYIGKIKIDMLDKVKYSTKGKGRGYGLLLANDILKKYNNFTQKREISSNYYIQKIVIDFKNIPIK